MKIAIIGNPVTNNSSGKFLLKISGLFSDIAQDTFIINDGRLKIKNSRLHVIEATRFNSRIKPGVSSIEALVGFFLAQIQLTFGLFKCAQEIDTVFVFPIIISLPTIFARIMRKRIFLYEAQDILWEYPLTGLSSKLRFFFMMFNRSIVLKLTSSIIVEGDNVVSQNHLEQYRSKIDVCPMFIDINRYRIKNPNRERNSLVGFIASIERRKGILEFVNAINKIRDREKNIRFVIVGVGPLLETARNNLGKLISSNIVKFVDNIPEKSFSDFLNELKLYVLPSVSEGLPNTILEAMACGCLVLATPVGAIPNVITDESTGFIMQNNTSDCIVANITRALFSNKAEEISENARRIVEEQYNHDLVLDRFKNVLSSNH
jgi:glycosyltransferase involved in cell wall biosynthesis